MSQKTPYVIGIAGGTASGKTTLAQMIKDYAGPNQAELIMLDSYYWPQNSKCFEEKDLLNYDQPQALDLSLLVKQLRQLKAGESVQVPVYNFCEHNRKSETVTCKPAPIIIVEGIFTLWLPELREICDFKVFVDADTQLRFDRRLQRDVAERGRTEDSVRKCWKSRVEPGYLQYSAPTKKYADLVVVGEKENLEQAARSILDRANAA